jgi:mannose-6-phosphate isomerase-like protein (cupin superfamily)
MVRKAEDMVKEIKEQMRGGKGSVEILHAFRQDELKGKCRLCAKITLQPGCSIGLHEHVNEEEIYYIMKGKGRVEDSGSTYEVNGGDAVLTGGGAAHSIENTGDVPLELMAVILLF